MVGLSRSVFDVRRLLPHLASGGVFVATFLYVLPAATNLADDHFMHLIWGRQILKGRLLVRDMAVLGMPLQSVLSAVAEEVIGYRLLSTGLIFSTAFATGAVLLFTLARRASGSAWIGLAAATLQVIAAPPTYSYPKVLVYAAGIALLWRYIDNPSRRRAAVLGAAIATAFFLRHDHGLYLALATAGTLTLHHAHDWGLGARRLTLVSAVCVAVVAPYLLFIQANWGIGAYLQDVRALAIREYQQNRFETWPRWPLNSLDTLARSNPTDAAGVMVGIRWNPDSNDRSRRKAASRYGLEIRPNHPVDSGSYLLTDVSQPNTLALLRDPVIEDTSGIDRQTGAVRLPGLHFGSLHLLPGLDTPPRAAAFLLYAVAGVLAVTLVTLAGGRRFGIELGALPRTKIAAVLLVGVVCATGFIREPLSARIADALVAPLVLAAWWAGRVIGEREKRGVFVRCAAVVTAALVLILTTRSVAVVGNLSLRTPWHSDHMVSVGRQLLTSPPFDAWSAVGSARYEIVRYVRTCTPPDEPLLVLWFAPDLYYYADRPFAGRLGFYMEGYWTSARHEQLNLEALRRDRPVLAIVEAGREKTDLYTYPVLLGHLARRYHLIGELTSVDGRVLRVMARNDRVPMSIDPDLGWPCYADAEATVPAG